MSTASGPDLSDALAALDSMSKKELQELAKQTKSLERKLGFHGPQNDDELHAWILEHCGINVTRVACCDNHNAPFDFISDLYFERVDSVLLMANRGGGKTFLVAILHLLNGKYKPGCESATVGAIEAQARRAYSHVQKLVAKMEDEEVDSSILSKTRWKNGSELEVLAGTMSAVNGPHPQKVHFDEVELADPEVYYESRQMSASKVINGSLIKAQDIITSTRKYASGMMQTLVAEIQDAELDGHEPPYKLYQWCVFDIAAPVKNCHAANPHLSEDKACPCGKVFKGKWDDGTPRSLKSVCGGKLARSQGFLPLDDIINTFTKSTRGIWEAQQECSRPSTAGLVIPQWRPERYGLKKFMPDPDNGRIFMSVDFGGTNPHAVLWSQLLDYDVDAVTLSGAPIRLKEGTLVIFDELYMAEIGNNQLLDLVHARERQWAKIFPAFRVTARFPDPQAKAARLDWSRARTPARTVFYASRDVKEHIKLMVEWLEDDRLYVDLGRCEMFGEEIAVWHYPKKKAGMIDDPDKPVDDFDHAMSAARYKLANVVAMETKRGGGMAPVSTGGNLTSRAPETSLPRSIGRDAADMPRSERWRLGLGGPVGRF